MTKVMQRMLMVGAVVLFSAAVMGCTGDGNDDGNSVNAETEIAALTSRIEAMEREIELVGSAQAQPSTPQSIALTDAELRDKVAEFIGITNGPSDEFAVRDAVRKEIWSVVEFDRERQGVALTRVVERLAENGDRESAGIVANVLVGLYGVGGCSRPSVETFYVSPVVRELVQELDDRYQFEDISQYVVKISHEYTGC